MNDLVDYSVIGMDLLLENPGMTHDQFAAEMIAEFGAGLRLFTRAIYAQAQAMTEMTPADY